MHIISIYNAIERHNVINLECSVILNYDNDLICFNTAGIKIKQSHVIYAFAKLQKTRETRKTIPAMNCVL